ncbi:MAG TPA: ABC transporter permease [Gemmatimonadota bacterium]|nr:ABC transporter permease [Gemmatimonadota bacterium]
MTDDRRGRIARLAGLVPGLLLVLSGRRRLGYSLLALGAALLTVFLVSASGLTSRFSAGRADHWVALLTLIAGAAVAWGVPLLAVGRGAEPGATSSQWAIAWREFRKNRLAIAGLYLLAIICLATLLTPFLTPYDPGAIGDIAATRHLPPSLVHPMGTDRFGRDVLTRVLYGSRVSLSIALIAVSISITLGTLVGAVAGYAGGATDNVLMRIVDMLISFPRLVLLITVIALFDTSILLVIVVLGLTLWPSTARIVRGEVLSLREREFIEAARALGFSAPRIVLRHVIPNVMGPVIVAATLGLGNIILIEAGLSFLGLGVQPPTPSWGVIIKEGASAMVNAYWVTGFAGLAIVVTVIAFNLVGDGLRDALDPRLNR